MGPTSSQLRSIIQIQNDISRLSLDLGGIMQLVCERTATLLATDGIAVELVDGDEMVYRAAHGIAKPQLGLRLKRNNSLSGLCVQSGQLLHCRDSETDDRVNREACRSVGLRSMIVLPLRHRETSVGVLKAMSRAPNGFRKVYIELLSMMTDVLSASIYFSIKYDQDALLYKATHDEMTGLPNRSLFMERLRDALAGKRANENHVAVMMVDMDNLKLINDRLGHRAGDAALCEIARRLQAVIRSQDLAARLGGDEFALLMTRVDDVNAVSSVAKRLAAQSAKPLLFEGHSLPIAVSIGSALSPVDAIDPNRLIAAADDRMYAVKRAAKRETVRT